MNASKVPFNIVPQVVPDEPQGVRALVTGFEKSGKSYNSIKWALLWRGIDVSGWTKEQVREFAPRSPVVVIETSREDVGIYADFLPFRLVRVPYNLNNPANLTMIIKAYESDPSIEAVVVDSYSEAWDGEGGTLSVVDNFKGNSLEGWKQIRPLEAAHFNAIRNSRLDLWFTVRMRDGISVEKTDDGKTVVTKEKDRPVQRKSVGFEFGQLFHLEADGANLTTKFFGRYLGEGAKSMSGKTFRTDSQKDALAFHKGLAAFMGRTIGT